MKYNKIIKNNTLHKNNVISIKQLVNSISAVQIFHEENVCVFQIKNHKYPPQVFIEVGLEDLDCLEVFSKKYVDLLGKKPKLTKKERDEFKQFTLGKASKKLTEDYYHLELAYRLTVCLKELDSISDSGKALNKLYFYDGDHVYITKLKVQSILDKMKCNLPLVVLKNILAECGLVYSHEAELLYGNKLCLKTWCLTSKMFPLITMADTLESLKRGVVL